MRMIRRGHYLTYNPHVQDDVPFVHQLFVLFKAAV
jgi:hypothetical protein